MSFCIAGMPTKSEKLQPLCFQTGGLFFNVAALKPASLILPDFLHCNWRHLSASYRVTPVRLKLVVDPQHECIESGNGHNREPDHCGIMVNTVASWEVDQTLKRPTATAIHGCYMGERNQNFNNNFNNNTKSPQLLLDYCIEKLLEGLVESLQEPVHDAKINAEAQERVHRAIHSSFMFTLTRHKSHATFYDRAHLYQ